jgi:hypothetical protein
MPADVSTLLRYRAVAIIIELFLGRADQIGGGKRVLLPKRGTAACCIELVAHPHSHKYIAAHLPICIYPSL